MRADPGARTGMSPGSAPFGSAGGSPLVSPAAYDDSPGAPVSAASDSAPASPAASPAQGVLIVGYGNPLRSDDGVGPVVAERIASDPRFAGADIRAEHQLTPELAYDASRSWLLVLVDAAEGVAAGEVVVRSLDLADSAGEGESGVAGRIEVSGPPLTHHVDPAGILGLAAELWGTAPRAVLVGIGPASLELGEQLTPLVEAAVPRAVDAIAGALAARHAARTASRAGEE